MSEPLNQWIRNQILEDQLWNTDIVSTNADQYDQTRMSDNSSLEISNDQMSRGLDQEQHQNVDEEPATEQEQTIINTNEFLDAQQYCNSNSTTIENVEHDEINESVLPRNPSLEPHSALKSSNVIVMSDERNVVADSKKAKDDASIEAAQLKEKCKEIRKSKSSLEDNRHIATTQRMEVIQNMNCRVLIERLQLPSKGHDSQSVLNQSALLPLQDCENQITNINDESNILQRSVTIVSDDVHEEFVNNADHERTLPNEKRKNSKANVGGNLKKKPKLTDTVAEIKQRCKNSRSRSSCRSSSRLAPIAGKRM